MYWHDVLLMLWCDFDDVIIEMSASSAFCFHGPRWRKLYSQGNDPYGIAPLRVALSWKEQAQYCNSHFQNAESIIIIFSNYIATCRQIRIVLLYGIFGGVGKHITIDWSPSKESPTSLAPRLILACTVPLSCQTIWATYRVECSAVFMVFFLSLNQM